VINVAGRPVVGDEWTGCDDYHMHNITETLAKSSTSSSKQSISDTLPMKRAATGRGRRMRFAATAMMKIWTLVESSWRGRVGKKQEVRLQVLL
jgi:hypothetical protein